MTGPDIYSPSIIKHERTGATRTMSEGLKGRTISEDNLYAILNRLKVVAKFNEPLRVNGEFWPNGDPLFLKPDALIDDPQYGSGVFEVDGASHKTKGSIRWDTKKDLYYGSMGLWVERLQNKEVKQVIVLERLEKHKRKVLGFP